MNTSPFYLLLLFLLSTCLAKVKEEQNNSQASHITKTRSQKQLNTSLEASCPEAADIVPCVCYNESRLIMDCSEVQDEEQLREVFTAFFPNTNFYQFKMTNNKGVVVLEDGVFGNVSFQVLTIWNATLDTVRGDALTSSFSSLEYIFITATQLADFPFDRLAEFTALHSLDLSINNIHSLPPFSSSSLTYLRLYNNSISHLSPDVFTLLTAIEVIILRDNQLTEITPGIFTSLPHLDRIELAYNNISSLHSLTFAFPATARPSYLGLSHNAIDFVEVDAFKGVDETVTLYLGYNALTTLEERVWRPVLENNLTIRLEGNPFSCGCDIAWLIRNPSLLKEVKQASCADGTLLTDLHPADFDICG